MFRLRPTPHDNNSPANTLRLRFFKNKVPDTLFGPYDDLSNRLTFTANAATTTAMFNAVNEMTKLNTTDVLSDDAGNLTKDDKGYTYHYDPDNKITLIRKTNDTVDVAKYDYDAQGRRIQFIDSVNSVTKTYYHEADQDRVLAEFDGTSTNRQRYYVWGNYIDELLVMHDEASGGDRFVCANHLYSPLALLNDSGGIVETYEYDAYGKPTIYVNNGGDSNWWNGNETTANSSAQGLVYLFTGRELDCLDNGNLRIQYSRYRYYDFHRWFTRDPFGYPNGMNAYEYVKGNPTYWVDPNGLEGVRDTLGGLLAVMATQPVVVPASVLAQPQGAQGQDGFGA